MRLVLKLGAAFASFTVLSTVALGFVLREQLRADETERFDRDVRGACEAVKQEVRHQAESDSRLIHLACQSGELVDRTVTWISNGEIDNKRLSLQLLVPNTAREFDLNELMLVTGQGDVLGAEPQALWGTPAAQVRDLLKPSPGHFALRLGPNPSIVSRCRLDRGGQTVGLIGARFLVPLLARLSRSLDLMITVGSGTPAALHSGQAPCNIEDGEASLPIVVTNTKRKEDLNKTLAYIDRTILATGAVSASVALLIAFLLARSMSRPIAELAAEARKVATDQANPLRVRGSGEIAELVQAFDKMIEDLAATRRRLAATSRVAAWREVARRVAHEVKNPLAPIRAAVETLRRLRARDDPAFDEYFDEATRTVLDEVHRIANIVTEFTRFARLPAPRPQDTDLADLAKQVVQLQKANAGEAEVVLEVQGPGTRARADRDQIVQVVTNLVQNAVDAVRGRPGGRVLVSVAGTGVGLVEIAVRDNGPGVAPDIAGRLFEPYATTKAHGTGLGLAIAQRIAMEHNGELSYVKEGVTEGALFRLVLPVDGPAPVSEVGDPTSA
jgi:two-component system, NtrC family, nitrogen regulation sensor histidine kinase NtrY